MMRYLQQQTRHLNKCLLIEFSFVESREMLKGLAPIDMFACLLAESNICYPDLWIVPRCLGDSYLELVCLSGSKRALASFVLNNGFIRSNFTDKKQNQSFYFRIWYRGIEAGIGKMQLKGEIIQFLTEIFCF